MLKIKDNVDLKELEKYGFEYEEEYDYGTYHYRNFEDIYVDTEYGNNKDFQRKITIGTANYEYNNFLDIIYDLIKDDLVEKVED